MSAHREGQRENSAGDFSKIFDREGKPCRACTDMQTYRKMMALKFGQNVLAHKQAHTSKTTNQVIESEEVTERTDCPLEIHELGRNTWSFLHTMAAYYPDRPTETQKEDMKNFMHLFSKFYPCGECAEDLRRQIKEKPPTTESRYQLAQWLCRIHNGVNERLGKPIFDCSKVDERWRDGWEDGSCD
ncbi:FAD-linked sulfhydryl oxidase ALR [Lingula anatina]|uniref:Sulfhydryl oxidase n=1 Tax=Lingula anatina TaxID=7574 RepID=A0A1S3J937_LINAN|nr:FAD-linked sulfhydryl oxidase ALR [Lingula anatina]|eukprot:XP_013406384.1 FAD-linked sulfhydryl oxidase ALR [Lingula anatina]